MGRLPAGAGVARFGLYEADLDERLLSKSGLRIRLQDQPFKILTLLLGSPGEVVTREEIRHTLWPADTYVEFDDGLNNAIKKLRSALCDSAENPRFIETVPRRGYRFVAPVQFSPPVVAGAAQVLPAAAAGDDDDAEQKPGGALEKSAIRRLPLWGALAALTVTALASGYFYRAQRKEAPSGVTEVAPATPASKARPTVAVIGFRNLSRSGDAAWLSTALAEMLNTELAAGENLRLVPGEQISRAKLDLSLADTEALARDSLARVRTGTGADYVVLGSYTALGHNGKSRIRLDLRLQDTRVGETIAEDSVSGSEVELFDLASDAGARLRRRLRAGALASEQAVQVRASLPSNVKATRLYAEGLARLRVFDALTARDLLQQAVAADPRFPMAHAALSAAWSALGYDSRAADEAKQAFDLSVHLGPEERLLAEGRYREANREWPRATEIYATLWRTFPDNLDYGLRLASVQSSAGRGAEALDTLESLRRLPLGAGSDPRIDLEESRGAEMMGDFRRSLLAAERAESKGRAQGARLVVAQARSDEGWDWDRLGEFDKAAQALAEARTLFAAAGDHRSTALAVNMIGDLQYDKGEVESALATLKQSLAMCRAHGFEKWAARSLNAIGNIQKDQGQLHQARATYEEVLRINRETGVRAGVAAALSNIGNVLQDLGELKGARKNQEAALQEFTDIGDKRGMGATLGNLGNLLDDLGDLKGAIQCYERAYALDQDTGYKRGLGFALSGWGRVLLEGDQPREARVKLEEALKVRKEMGSPDLVGDSMLALAALGLEQDQAGEAEKLARDSATQFAKVKAVEDEATANAVLARALLAEGRLAEARTASERALARAQLTPNLPSTFEARIAVALVQAASGNAGEAARRLGAITADATRLGFTGYELRARLEVARIETRSGQAAGPEHLRSLETEAPQRGYRLIARRAAAALGPSG